MEQNPQILAKKAWNLLRVMFFMLKKHISKTKLFADLNMMIIKRGKIAGKTLNNLLFHHHHHHHHLAASTFHHPTPPPSDDEFSCTTTPQHQNHINNIVIDHVKTMEMLTRMAPLEKNNGSATDRLSPVVRQLRITDSPFPLSNGDDDGKVDEDAEKFILRFYNGLKLES